MGLFVTCYEMTVFSLDVNFNDVGQIYSGMRTILGFINEINQYACITVCLSNFHVLDLWISFLCHLVQILKQIHL